MLASRTVPKSVPPRLVIVGGTGNVTSESVQRTDACVSGEIKQQMIATLPQLRRFARTLTRSVTEADDLVQEACLRALNKADLWDPSQPFDRWMFRLTRNLWISEMRKRTVRLGQGHVPAEESHELVNRETGETAVAYNQLKAQVDALPGDLSTVLLLVSVEGYSYAEASDILEIPIGTVMSRIHRARKTLAKRLEATQGDAP